MLYSSPLLTTHLWPLRRKTSTWIAPASLVPAAFEAVPAILTPVFNVIYVSLSLTFYSYSHPWDHLWNPESGLLLPEYQLGTHALSLSRFESLMISHNPATHAFVTFPLPAPAPPSPHSLSYWKGLSLVLCIPPTLQGFLKCLSPRGKFLDLSHPATEGQVFLTHLAVFIHNLDSPQEAELHV